MTASASGSSRYIDLAISVRVGDVAFDEATGKPARDASGNVRWKNTEQLIRIGGCWDRRRKRWAPGRRAAKVLPITFHRGQEPAARWFCSWLTRFVRNDWRGVKRAWSLLLIGGRRSGKTHLACAALVLFAILHPKALIWAVSPTLETGDELDEALKSLVPRRWYVRKQAKTGRSTTFTFANKSRILLKSGVKPERLKAGRVDIALLNEAQEQQQLAYVKLRAPIADRGGILLVTANPPDRPSGRWVEEHYNAAKAGSIEGEVFELDPRENPTINYQGLASIALEVDQKSFDRDVLGLFPPIGDIVFEQWDPRESVREIPPGWVNVTREVTRKHFGRAFPKVIGIDLQLSPHMCAAVLEWWRCPTTGDDIPWVVDEVVCPEADEGELIDELEAKGYHGGTLGEGDDPEMHSVVVMDASAWWQDGAHHKGKKSDKEFRARGWYHLHRPQKDSDRNPDIMVRVNLARARIKSAAAPGIPARRRMFSLPTNTMVNDALRRWENRNGFPNRRSDYAHICDAVTYAVFRIHGPPKVKKNKAKYHGAGRFDRRDAWSETRP